MTLGMVMRTIFEAAMVLFVIWGIFHEDRLIAFERNLVAHLRRRKLRVVKPRYERKNVWHCDFAGR